MILFLTGVSISFYSNNRKLSIIHRNQLAPFPLLPHLLFRSSINSFLLLIDDSEMLKFKLQFYHSVFLAVLTPERISIKHIYMSRMEWIICSGVISVIHSNTYIYLAGRPIKYKMKTSVISKFRYGTWEK